MEDEDFNFDEFMENSQREFESNLAAYKERMMLIAIESNYDNIAKNGISEWHLRHLPQSELNDLNETFRMMIEHFQDLEEYEKCAVILAAKNKIVDALKIKQNI
jgi:hypothetical protein